MNYDKYKIGKQPCNNLKPTQDQSWFRYPTYKCNFCKKQVVFCINCPGVHHENGWKSCNKNSY